jgi:hypothetical protein
LLKQKCDVAGRPALANHIDDGALAGFRYPAALEQFDQRAVGRRRIVGLRGGPAEESARRDENEEANQEHDRSQTLRHPVLVLPKPDGRDAIFNGLFSGLQSVGPGSYLSH